MKSIIFSETVFVLKKIVCFAALFVVVSTLTIFTGCSEEARVDGYEISCEYRDGVLSLKETATFSCPADGVTEAVFNLYPLAFTSDESGCTLSDDEKGRVDVNKISLFDKPADHVVDNTHITVLLDRSYKKGETIEIGFNIDLTLPKCDERFSVNENTVNFGNFYPILAKYEDGKFTACDHHPFGDPFYSGVADYKVAVKVPSIYTVAAGVTASSLDNDDEMTTYFYNAKNLRDFSFVLSDKYEVKSEKWGNKSINYYFYEDEQPDETFKVIVDALEFFSKKFGDYPYESYSVAKTRFSAGGMEYPLLSYLSDRLDKEQYLYALVHETAHQWWYSAVGNDQINESYLDESLAEYSTYLFFDERPELNISGDGLIKSAINAANVCENSVLKADDSFVPKVKAPLSYFKTEYVYVNMVYNKGLVMMKAAENAVGKKRMISMLSKYYSRYLFKEADTDDFLSAMGDAAPIITSFLEGKTRVYL